MSQQYEGWPLGLQPLNARIGLGRNGDNLGSISFNTLITGSSSSSTDSSSDLDTESTGSFFPDKSTTFGNLIGVSTILELSRRSIRGVKTQVLNNKKGNKCSSKYRTWLFCLCSSSTADADADQNDKNPPSLGHFLAVEREAANQNRRNQSLPFYVPDEFGLPQTIAEPNSLFVNGTNAIALAPPRLSNEKGESEQNNGLCSMAELFPCMCG
ncbi:hypothetical protein L6164_019201 [Bauhinia variegata]|uniref:Uncharacterized protein n=1 Tax=Bauhinia variegata TaxID=167791 RepID=A0ACB9NER0_BAUVA|nr:hypothetical protein L6164_019201 [Bauhinia variegata]